MKVTKNKYKILLISLLSIMALIVPILGCATGGKTSKGTIFVHVHVLKDLPEPGSEFALREGEPKEVGIYKFYLKKPGIPGTGTFKKLSSITLEKINETEFYGKKGVERIEGTLCVGYPSTNFIDKKACVEIDQTQDEVEITVHYWKTSLLILK